MWNNYNHRPCRWYAQAPLGPFTSRAYRLIELSFACLFCPTTANAVANAPTAPSDEGAVMPNGMTEGENSRDTSSFSPSAPSGHLPHQREALVRCESARRIQVYQFAPLAILRVLLKKLYADGIWALYVENIFNGDFQSVLEKKTAFKGIYAQ